MKRVISLIVCLCMALPIMSAYAQEDSAKAHESYEILSGMGLMQKETSENMTRGEFAQLLYDAKHFSDTEEADNSWNTDFFNALEEESKLIEDVGTDFDRFTDVDPYDKNTGAIIELVNIGIMNGVSDTEFSPDQNVKNIEIVKSVLNIMGYKTMSTIKGGYPYGYQTMAAELGITDGVSGRLYEDSTASDAARILYNAFDVKLIDFSIGKKGKELKTSDTDTFLTKIMKVDYTGGVITDNGITSLYGSSDVGKNKIVCNGMVFDNVGSNASDIRNYLGYNVKMFYYTDGDMADGAIYAVPLKKNSVLTIDINDFNSYDNRTINYNYENTTKNARISDEASFIYNGAAVTSFTKDIFDFDNGFITLIAPNGGKYETLIIKSYVSMYVGSIDTKSNIIYNKAYSADDEKYPASFSFNEAVENETLTIKNTDGKELNIGEISQGDVIDVSKNGNIVEIILSLKKAEKFKISSTGSDDGRKVLSDSENRYAVDSAFVSAENAAAYAMGDTVTLYLNSFNRIVWIEKSNEYFLNVGYLLRVVHDEDETDEENAYFVKLINTDGSGVKYYFADKVRYGDSETVYQGDYKRLKPQDVYRRMQNLSQGIIGYGLDEDKRINYIELPLNKREGENRLQLIYDSGAEAVMYKNDAGGKFKDFTWTDNNTLVFTTPTNVNDLNDETKYNCVGRSGLFSSDGKYSFISYGTCAEGIRAEYMVLKRDVKDKLEFGDEDQQYFIVTDVIEGLDENDEPSINISGYKTSAYKGANLGLVEMTLYAKEGAGINAAGESVNPARSATATIDLLNDNPKYYTVKKGDIIRYMYDSEDIFPTGIEILYRADMEGDYQGAKGALIGVKEYSDKNSLPYNIFAFSDSLGTLTTDVQDYYTQSRVFYSWLYSINKDIGTVTTRDLTISKYDPTMGITSYVPVATGATKVVVNYDNKNVSASLATANDYKSYKDYGSGCSRIITITKNGWTTFTIIINGEYGK